MIRSVTIRLNPVSSKVLSGTSLECGHIVTKVTSDCFPSLSIVFALWVLRAGIIKLSFNIYGKSPLSLLTCRHIFLLKMLELCFIFQVVEGLTSQQHILFITNSPTPFYQRNIFATKTYDMTFLYKSSKEGRIAILNIQYVIQNVF